MTTAPSPAWALVTGGSRGIGAAIARSLAATGLHTVVNFLQNEAAAAATLEAITAAGGSGELARFDVARRDVCRPAVEALLARLGAPHAIVHNAGIRRDGLMVWMQPDDWDRVIATNLTSFYDVVQPFLKAMLAARRGRIVAIASTAGQTGNPGQVNYAAAKAGLIGAVKSLAREVGKRSITANAVSPGFVATDMTADLPQEQLAAVVPAGRFGTPEEVAALVRFLVSDEAGYVNGQVLGINGGLA